MRVLVAGGTGVIGRQLLPVLDFAGHEVIALARSPERAAEMERTGIGIVTGDALNAEETAAAVAEARPDALVHLLTAVPRTIRPRHLARDFALTNRLRTEGTRNLLAACRQNGVRRVVAEGLAYIYDPDGEGPAKEHEPFWPDPPRPFAPVLAALRDLEAQITDAGGSVLRVGHLYGPGSAYASGGHVTERVRAAKFPQVGDGDAVFSFTHAQDAATAIATVLESGQPGTLNIVDDDPAPVREWLPFLAGVLDAPTPTQVPPLMARLVAGSWGAAYMTRLRGADNSKAKRLLDWEPRFRSWRDGFAAEFSEAGTYSGWTG